MSAYAAWLAGASAVLALLTWLVVRDWGSRIARELARERAELAVLQAKRDAAEAAKHAAEAQHMILMHEVDHRARNALTVAQSLVHLTLADDPERSAEVSARIAALAGAHGLLAENAWEGATLPAIVSRALAAFSGPSIVADGPSLQVGPASVQPLSMLLHELATNAAKYGALSAGGRVDIDWRDVGEEVVLTWAETGGPRIAAAPERTGVGTRVIEAVVRTPLQGRISREWKESGLVMAVAMRRAALAAKPDTGDPHRMRMLSTPAQARLATPQRPFENTGG
jgi:two-component sensor histidine kinase